MNKWDEAYIDTAERFGALSSAKRLQVGAIVVKDNRIVSIGYNGTPSGWDNECEDEIIDNLSDRMPTKTLKTKPEVIHAEANCIAKLAGSHESGKDAAMYVTHSPCLECAKQIYGAGIKTIYYRHDYRSKEGINFLIKCGLEVKQI